MRLYTRDAGWERVRALARTDQLACCLHAQAETAAVLHRKLREGALNQDEPQILRSEFEKDSNASASRWLPLSPFLVLRLTSTYARLPFTVALRVADAIHLGCASDAGLTRERFSD